MTPLSNRRAIGERLRWLASLATIWAAVIEVRRERAHRKMHCRMSSVLLAGSLLAGCRRAEVRRVDSAAASPTDTVEASRAGRRSDSSTVGIVVDRPVLVAFFATTQAEVDSSDDIGEALSDFQHYLPTIKLGLDSLGVTLREQYTDTVRYVAGGRARVWMPAKDSADIGYLLLRPDAEPQVQYAVATTDDVLDQVRKWLGRKTP